MSSNQGEPNRIRLESLRRALQWSVSRFDSVVSKLRLCGHIRIRNAAGTLIDLTRSGLEIAEDVEFHDTAGAETDENLRSPHNKSGPRKGWQLMSVKDDAKKVLGALAGYRGPDDPQRGRHHLDGEELQAALNSTSGVIINAERINDAVEWLETRGLVETSSALGTHPYVFAGVELTSEGRNHVEEASAATAETESRAEVRPAHVLSVNPRGGFMEPKKSQVFLVHGRDRKSRDAVVHFVRSLGLDILDFDDVAGELGATFVGDIVKSGIERAHGVVILMTPDEAAWLRDELRGDKESSEDLGRWQSRPIDVTDGQRNKPACRKKPLRRSWSPPWIVSATATAS